MVARCPEAYVVSLGFPHTGSEAQMLLCEGALDIACDHQAEMVKME